MQDGKEFTQNILSDGQSFCESLLFNGKPYPMNAIAKTEYRISHLLRITMIPKVNNAFGIPVVIKTTFYFNVPIIKITRPEEIVEFARYKRKAYGNNLVWATFS